MQKHDARMSVRRNIEGSPPSTTRAGEEIVRVNIAKLRLKRILLYDQVCDDDQGDNGNARGHTYGARNSYATDGSAKEGMLCATCEALMITCANGTREGKE